MLIPLRAPGPRRRFALVTAWLVWLNALIFLYQLTLDALANRVLILRAGAIPYEVVTFQDLPPPALIVPPLTIFTSMFLHGGFLHLVGNAWFLWLFGGPLEGQIGRGRFLAFYLATGTCGAVAQCLLAPMSGVPMIGASGAIAGVLGGYLLLFPRARILSLLPIPFFWPLWEVPAWILLGLWILGQFFTGADSGVAWMAHVGGFLAGVALIRLFGRGARPSSARVEVVEAEYIPPNQPNR